MDFEQHEIKSFLDEFVPKRKKLLSEKQILIIVISLTSIVFLHMHVILSPLPTNEQDKIAFLSAFTLFIAAPFLSAFLSIGLAFIPIYNEPYLKKYIFFTLPILLLTEMILFAITLFGHR